MKKIIKTPTYEELLASHLKPFEAEINGVKTNGVIFVKDKFIYLLQDEINGTTPNDKQWICYKYKYSWCYADGKTTNRETKNLSIEIEEEWKPKFGELVEVSLGKNDSYFRKRIFLFEKDGKFACVGYGEEETFKKNHSFAVSFWEAIRKIEEPKPIEISLDEAKKIIAESKNTTPDKINLNFKIN